MNRADSRMWLKLTNCLLFAFRFFSNRSVSSPKIITWTNVVASNWAPNWAWMRRRSKFGSRTNGPKSRNRPAPKIRWQCSWWPKDCTITRPCRWPKRKRNWKCAWTVNCKPCDANRIGCWNNWLPMVPIVTRHRAPVQSNGNRSCVARARIVRRGGRRRSKPHHDTTWIECCHN